MSQGEPPKRSGFAPPVPIRIGGAFVFRIEGAEGGADRVDLANGACSHLALQLGDKRMVTVHEAFHQKRARGLNQLRKLQRFLSVSGQRLLAEDVAGACVEAALDLLPMLVGPGGKDHTVQILVPDHRFVVRVPGFAVVGLGPFPGDGFANVAAGDELDLPGFQAGATMAGTDPAASNHPNAKGREFARCHVSTPCERSARQAVAAQAADRIKRHHRRTLGSPTTIARLQYQRA